MQSFVAMIELSGFLKATHHFVCSTNPIGLTINIIERNIFSNFLQK